MPEPDYDATEMLLAEHRARTTPTADDICRLEKAAWDARVDHVLVWERDRREAALTALAQAADVFCSVKCPSVFTSPDQPRHVPECDRIRALLESHAE